MSMTIEETVVREVAKKVVGKLDTDALAAKVATRMEKELPKLVADHFLDEDFLDDCFSDSKIMRHIIKYTEQSVAKKLGVSK